MTPRVCPGCQWTVHLPENLDEVLAACPECGQCLHVPAPWRAEEIGSCTTRPLVGVAGDGHRDARLPQALPRIPPELTARIAGSTHSNPSRRLFLGLGGMVMGLAALGMSLQNDPGGKLGTPMGRLFEGTVGVMMIFGGALLVRAGLRKRRRQTRARLLALPDSFPQEGYQLGAPQGLHQISSFTRVATVLAGLFTCALGAICLAMIARHEVTDHRFIGIAFMAPAGGFFLVWQGLRNHGVRILVFPEGLVLFRHHRAEAWRWDQIDAVHLQPDPVARPALAHVITLRRHDGERLVFNSGLEYVDNQLGVRVQAETCRRLLPRLWEAFGAGATLDFGPLQVCPEGIHKHPESCTWEEVTAVELTEEGLVIRRQDGAGRSRKWSLALAQVPNVALLLALVRRIRAARTNAPATPEHASRSQ